MVVNQNQIDEVIDKANIVDIIGKYIHIQKKGRNYLAVCPFHDDRDPSLHITPSKKIFKCFVCGVGGNVITFVQEFNNITFFKALSLIANEAKIKIKGLSNYEEKSRFTNAETRVIAINTEAAKFFNSMLITNYGKKAREYLQKRLIRKSEISHFQIGFAPKAVDLKKYLLNKGFEERDIENSKLFSMSGSKEWSFFDNRLIFPIWDKDKNLIGFSGRAIFEGDEPKYKNSGETIVFKKSQLAYNLTNAVNHIRIANEVLILEGFMDVISLERIGIKNSVAIMGTTLSDYHVKTFSKLTKNFKLFLDGDRAGVRAALKTAQFLMDCNINVTIIENKTLKDPDELVITGNQNMIEEMIMNAKHPIDFAIDYFLPELNSNDSNSISSYVKNIVNIIEHEQSKIIRTASINRLAGITNLPRDEITNLIKENIKIEVWDSLEALQANPEHLNEMWNGNDVYFGEIESQFVNHSQFDELSQSEYQSTPNIDFEKNKLNITHSTEQLNLFNERRKRAESMLLIDLIDNSTNLTIIKENLEVFTNFSYMKVAEHVIEMYEKNEYEGNSLSKIEKSISEIKGLSISPLYEMKNRVDFFSGENQYTMNGIYDILDTIRLYRLWNYHNETLHKMISVTDSNAKLILHGICEKIMDKIRDIANLKEERNK